MGVQISTDPTIAIIKELCLQIYGIMAALNLLHRSSRGHVSLFSYFAIDVGRKSNWVVHCT